METPVEDTDQQLDPIEECKTMPKKLPELPTNQQNINGITCLSGFIERDQAIGKIDVDGFYLSIKGLSSDHEQKINFTLSEWKLLLSLMKYYNEPLKVMIGNYKSSSEEFISKRKLIKVLQKYVKHAESKNRNKSTEFNDVLTQKATSKIVKKLDFNKTEGNRYLFEIGLPKVTISYLHHETKKDLSSDDIEHL